MTFADWVSNSADAIRYQGPVYGTREAVLDFYLGARNRLSWLRRLSGDTRRISAADVQARIRQETETEFKHYRNFRNERPLVEDVLDHARPDDVFWDVGANLGTYTCLVGQAVGETVAFEPYPPNVVTLRQNVGLNHLDDVTVEALALADHAGESTFAVDERAEPGAGQGSLVQDGDEEITVATERGDALVEAGLPAPDVIKIDVEGAEALVIEGLSETLGNGAVRHVYCEIHSADWEPVADRFCDLGYRVTLLEESSKSGFVRADGAV